MSGSSSTAHVASHYGARSLLYPHLLLSLPQGSAWLSMRVTSTRGPLMGKTAMAAVTMASSS